ncbi:DUF5682 family protein, partial [Streptosporangium sp. NPDC006013]|uniref:DUF5682 family protein n=1 Tax=Streptosporangium sp. NPDC006013 TaxID=3155596 RepID=UPI00339E776D
GDVTHLMAALPAMVRAQRYGDVRGTPATGLTAIAWAMLTRICVGLGGAVTGLDDDAARDLIRHIDAVHTAVSLLEAVPAGPGVFGGSRETGAQGDPGASAGSAGLDGPADAKEARSTGASGGAARPEEESPQGRWLVALRGASGRSDLHGLIEGRLTRILLDAADLDTAEAGRRMSLAMSAGHPPARAASWIEGFLSGGGLLLVHDSRLLGLVDEWLTGLAPETFVDVLPLLRRTFGAFAAPERRSIGSRVRSLGSGGADRAPDAEEFDEERAAAAVRTVLAILGRTGSSDG